MGAAVMTGTEVGLKSTYVFREEVDEDESTEHKPFRHGAGLACWQPSRASWPRNNRNSASSAFS